MKAKYNELYNFMLENEGRDLQDFTLKEIGEQSGLLHPQAVKNGISYLVKNRYLIFTMGSCIEVHDGNMYEQFTNNASDFLFDYIRMRRIISQINSLTQP